MRCLWDYLGLIEYDQALSLQERFRARKAEGLVEEVLLLLEHPPTLTVGKRGKWDHLLVPLEELRERGLAWYRTDRGGDITFHGPGQLVAYPIMDLRKRGFGLRDYLWGLQETVIRLLADFSLAGERDPEQVGVWVGSKKICAFGVAVRHGITTHGLALNVNTDLSFFSLIHPCGLTDRGVTSMADRKNAPQPMGEIVQRFVDHFSRVFSLEMIRKDVRS